MKLTILLSILSILTGSFAIESTGTTSTNTTTPGTETGTTTTSNDNGSTTEIPTTDSSEGYTSNNSTYSLINSIDCNKLNQKQCLEYNQCIYIGCSYGCPGCTFRNTTVFKTNLRKGNN